MIHLSNYIITSTGSFIRDDDLYHWGIKGMKWGVRRYQNKDGSLTEAGKKRLRNEVEDSYAKSSNMQEFGNKLISQKGIRNWDMVNKTRKDFTSKLAEYNRVVDAGNFQANAAASKAVGGKSFMQILGDEEKMSLYMDTGKKVSKEYFEKHSDTLNKMLDDASNLGKKYEVEVRSVVNDFLKEYGSKEVSYPEAVSYNLKTNKVNKQTIADMTVNSLLSSAGVIALEDTRRRLGI